jgi:hypothetical protein
MRNPICLIAVAALCAFAMSACSTAHKRAKELLEQGLYDDAVAAYDALVAADPKDEDALDGQKKAREQWIDRKLIEVRLQRQAGNSMESITRLLDVVERERKWGMAPGGKVAFTQGEERDDAVVFAGHEVGRALAAKMPLKAHVFLTRFAPVLEGQPDARVERMKQLTRQAGQESCKPWSSGKGFLDKLNLERLLRRYCQLWGAAAWPPPKPGLQTVPPYYKGLEIKAHVEGLGADARVALEDRLSRALMASAWHEPGSPRSLTVAVSGRYQQDLRSSLLSRTHVYSEDQPYQERVAVTKSRSVPYTENVNGQVVTQYRQEQYTDYETLTRHRTVYKEYPYRVTKLEQSLAAELLARFNPGEPSEVATHGKSEKSGYEHDERLPAIGLMPQRASLADPKLWLSGVTASFVAAFADKLAARWDELHCATDAAGTDLFAAGEAVARCLRQRHARAPEGAQQWFGANFGTSVEDGLAAVGYP